MQKDIEHIKEVAFTKTGLILKIISFYFIFLFVYTGFSKLMDNQSLFTALRNAPLFLKTSLAIFLSWVVPITEIILAIMLSIKKTSRYGWTGTIILLTIFTLYTGWIVLVSPYEPCTCGGLMSLLSWKQHLFFNLSSLALAIWAYRLNTIPNKT